MSKEKKEGRGLKNTDFSQKIARSVPSPLSCATRLLCDASTSKAKLPWVWWAASCSVALGT